MVNAGAKLSSFPEVNDIQTGDMFPLLSDGNTNAKIDYATLARAIIAKLKSEDVVQAQTNNASKLISAALAYSMNQDILQLEEDTSTEQEEKSVTAGIVTVEDADGGDAGLTLNLEPHQSGSGDPSPKNVRPISGYDDVNVTRTGKNLLDVDRYGDRLPRITAGVTWSKVRDGVYHVSGTATSTSYFNVSFISSLQDAMPCTSFIGQRLRLSTTDARVAPGLSYFRENGSNVFMTNDSVLPDDAVGLRAYVRVDAGIVIDTDFSIQLEIDSTATAYEPYAGSTYPITFPSEAGTVYGGTLDVTSGVLTVTDAQIASYAGETLPGEWISDRDVYAAGASPTTGAQVVYELATPVTYQLTPIEVTTLLGDNTIWMDAEGTIKLDYKTNAIATKGDVNEAIARIKALAKIAEAIAPVESSYTATQNYSVGDYLIVDYKLYKVTAAIANGGTITVGTNVTATTIMAEIKALA